MLYITTADVALLRLCVSVSENPAEPFTRADYLAGGRVLFLTDPFWGNKTADFDLIGGGRRSITIVVSRLLLAIHFQNFYHAHTSEEFPQRSLV